MYSLEERYNLIEKDIIIIKSKNPVQIAKNIMKNDYVSIQGKE